MGKDFAGSKFWRKKEYYRLQFKKTGLNSVLRHKGYLSAYIPAGCVKKCTKYHTLI